MPNIIEQDTLIEVHNRDGDITRHFPITKMENVIGLSNSTGQQNSVLNLLALNPYIVDDENGKVYKIGSKNGKLYFQESDINLSDLMGKVEEEDPGDNEEGGGGVDPIDPTPDPIPPNTGDDDEDLDVPKTSEGKDPEELPSIGDL